MFDHNILEQIHATFFSTQTTNKYTINTLVKDK